MRHGQLPAKVAQEGKYVSAHVREQLSYKQPNTEAYTVSTCPANHEAVNAGSML